MIVVLPIAFRGLVIYDRVVITLCFVIFVLLLIKIDVVHNHAEADEEVGEGASACRLRGDGKHPCSLLHGAVVEDEVKVADLGEALFEELLN